MASQADVIIIGAGVAGLSAAKEFAKRGLSYILVEGSGRIGGRARSEEIAPGVWFDLGCAYITTNSEDTERNPFFDIAKDLGVEIGIDKGNVFDEQKFFHNGKRLTEKEEALLWQYFEGNEAAIRASVNRGEDRAISELIDLDHPYAQVYNDGISTMSPRDIDQYSAADYADTIDDQEIPVFHGYGNLVNNWGADVPVSFNTTVESIDWSEKQVRVKSNRGTLQGRCVLSTVSNGILGVERILFRPRLPSWKMEAIQGVPMGTENKTGVHFDKDVFGPDGRGAYHSWIDEGAGAAIEVSVMGLNLVSVFTGGRHAIWLEEQGQQAGHDYAVNQIANIFGNDIRKHVTHSIVSAWTRDPLTLGSYACAQPGQSRQRKELARAIDNRLFFAGEATINRHQGSCRGAYLSGIRAAQEIAGALG